MTGAIKGMATLGIAFGIILTLAMVSQAQGKGGGGGKPPKGSDDTDPPPAVTDLGTGLVTTESVELLWTASRDDSQDEQSGAADSYDVRYSTSLIDENNFDSATQVQGEDPPKDPGLPESFTVTGLLPGTDYFFALKVSDEVPNTSGLSNVVTAQTDPGSWSIEIVDDGVFLTSLAYDPTDGYPSIAYTRGSNAMFAEWDGTAWTTEVAVSGGGAQDLAYSSSGIPGITYLSGGRKPKLKFAERVGGSWVVETVANGLSNTWLSLAYDGNGDPAVAFGTSDSLRFGHRVGGDWTIQEIEIGAEQNKYPSLAYDSLGNPAIAYRFVPGDGTEALKYASWNGASWDIEVIESSASEQMGSDADLAFDPMTGFPSIIHTAGPAADICNPRELRFASWNGEIWNLDVIEFSSDGCIKSPSLAYDSLGTPHVSYSYPLPGDCSSGELRLASFDGIAWVTEGIQSVNKCFDPQTSLALDPLDVPALSYMDRINSNQLRFATKIAP
ncbi:MAG: hypothetical protein O7H41_11335 [Planctomycetota bacterium]|nr:hypothetical protein [Planctomycetota bacterium]